MHTGLYLVSKECVTAVICLNDKLGRRVWLDVRGDKSFIHCEKMEQMKVSELTENGWCDRFIYGFKEHTESIFGDSEVELSSENLHKAARWAAGVHYTNSVGEFGTRYIPWEE